MIGVYDILEDMQVEQASVLEALKVVRDPDLNRDIVSLGFIKDLKICRRPASRSRSS